MKQRLFLLLAFTLITINTSWASDDTSASACPAFLNHEFRLLHSVKTINLCELHSEKPILIVNTASHCSFVTQFKPLQELHERYSEGGLQIVGFASNDFDQEADSEAEAADICYKNFGVEFTMIAPTSVKGENANPVFKHLAEVSQPPEWNFVKYLVNSDGSINQRLASLKSPTNRQLRKELSKWFEE